MVSTSTDKLDAAVNRLNRNMALAQVALSTHPAAALFALQVNALQSAVEEVQLALLGAPDGYRITTTTPVIGTELATELAKVIGNEQPDLTDRKE